jgi:hypothetical protein
LGGFAVCGSWCIQRKKEIAPVSKRTKETSDFFAFVPDQIRADDEYGPLLEGFPLNILFAGMTDDTQTGKQSLISVCYWPAPETLREDSRRKEMRYVTRPKNGYSIRVIFEKNTGRWQTEKFKGKKLMSSAFGSTLDQTMIHTTMDGPERDER